MTTASGASAQDGPPRAQLSYERAPEASACPDEAGLRQSVATRLGYDPFVPAAEVRVDVDVRTDVDGLLARIEVERPGREPGVRELRSPALDCRELVQALVLAVSMAVDPAFLARPTAERPRRESESPDVSPAPSGQPSHVPPTAGPSRDSAAPAGPPRQVSPGRTHTVGAMAGVFVVVGTAPSAAFGLTAGLHVDWPAVRLGLAARAHMPSTEPVDGGSIRAALYGLDVTPCLLFGPVAACGLVVVGAVTGDAEGLAKTSSVTSPYLAGGVRMELALPLDDLAVRLWVDTTIQLARTTFLIDDVEAWEMPLGSLAAGAALTLPFS